MEEFQTTYTKTGKVPKAGVTRMSAAIHDNLRRIKADDVATLVKEVEAAHGTSIKRIRVYSSDGFVSNSYGRFTPIYYLEATIGDEGAISVKLGSGDARRPNSRGSRIVRE